MGPSFVTLLTLALPLVGAAPSNLHSRAGSCSVRGYDKGRPSAYFWSQSAKYRSVALCGAHCATDPLCISFAFGGNNECIHYQGTVASNVQAQSGSPYLFSDKSCVTGGTPSSQPSTPVGGASSRLPSSVAGAPSSSRAPSASSGPAPSTPSGLTCGRRGYDKKEAFVYNSNRRNTNFDACKALCTARSNCVSFGFGTDACLLYKFTVASNVNAVSGSPYIFYDRNCPGASSPSSVVPVSSPVVPSSTPLRASSAPAASSSPVVVSSPASSPIATPSPSATPSAAVSPNQSAAPSNSVPVSQVPSAPASSVPQPSSVAVNNVASSSLPVASPSSSDVLVIVASVSLSTPASPSSSNAGVVSAVSSVPVSDSSSAIASASASVQPSASVAPGGASSSALPAVSSSAGPVVASSSSVPPEPAVSSTPISESPVSSTAPEFSSSAVPVVSSASSALPESISSAAPAVSASNSVVAEPSSSAVLPVSSGPSSSAAAGPSSSAAAPELSSSAVPSSSASPEVSSSAALPESSSSAVAPEPSSSAVPSVGPSSSVVPEPSSSAQVPESSSSSAVPEPSSSSAAAPLASSSSSVVPVESSSSSAVPEPSSSAPLATSSVVPEASSSALPASSEPATSSVLPASSTIPSATPSLICNVEGLVANGENRDQDLGDIALDACAAGCENDVQCLTFAHGNGHCFLYYVAAETLIAPQTSGYFFYQRGCIVSIAATTPTVSAAVSVAATPSISATPSVSATPAANPVCGTEGLVANGEERYEDKGDVTLAVCAAACQSDSRCTIFAHGNSHCFLYDNPARTLVAPQTSGYFFYEPTCSFCGIVGGASLNIIELMADPSVGYQKGCAEWASFYPNAKAYAYIEGIVCAALSESAPASGVNDPIPEVPVYYFDSSCPVDNTVSEPPSQTLCQVNSGFKEDLTRGQTLEAPWKDDVHECQNLCRSEHNCASFAFVQGVSCELLTADVAFTRDDSADNKVDLWDVNCQIA